MIPGALETQPARVLGEVAPTESGEAGRMKLTVSICGQSAIIEGPAEQLQPHVERFFAITERALTHNIDMARRNADLQAQALQLQALAHSPGAGH